MDKNAKAHDYLDEQSDSRCIECGKYLTVGESQCFDVCVDCYFMLMDS